MSLHGAIVCKMKKEHKTPYDAIDYSKTGKHVVYDLNGKVCKVCTVTGKTKTDQAYKDETDLTHILEPAIRKGLLRHAIKFEGEYDDYPAFDFQEAQFKIARANTMFEQLPAKVRERFNNKPGDFLEFVNDPKNEKEIREMGLTKGLDGMKADGTPVKPPAIVTGKQIPGNLLVNY